MSSSSALTVFAPATVANVASGFDVLGFALQNPGDSVRLEVTDRKEVRIVTISGDNGRLPREAEKNTAAVAAASFLRKVGFPFGLDIALTKQMPLSSGLGSSAASSVAAVFGANLLAGSPLSRRDLLGFTLEAEQVACGAAHADNVAPALLGGFVLIRSYAPLDIVKLPVPPGLAAAVVHPHTEIKTEDARRILKKDLRLTDAVRQWGNLAALVAALYEQDLSLLGRSLQDVVAEPRRALLIPGFSMVKEAAMGAGALGCSISGSGPSVFSLCASLEKAGKVGRAMQAGFLKSGLESDLYVSEVNCSGPMLVEEKEA